MQKLVFSSEQLPADLDDQARFALWREIYLGVYRSRVDIQRLPDLPFSARFEYARFGAIGLAQFRGTVSRIKRSRNDVIADQSDDFFIGFNRGTSKMCFAQVGREAQFDATGGVLCSNAESGEILADGESVWSNLAVPRKILRELVPQADDLIARPVGHRTSAALFLRRYLTLLEQPAAATDDVAVREHIGITLSDLVALVLGAGRDAAHLAAGRGLRAARLRSIFAAIDASFADPAISAEKIGENLGLSDRYIQDLLQQTGVSFTERVLELRLQRARAMLSDPRHDRLSVADIAYRCGFNEVSYFNRRFRARFGATPSQFRGP